MNEKQKDLAAKTLADIGKGLLLASIIGAGTGQLSAAIFALDLIMAMYAIIAAHLLLRDIDDDADQSD